MQQPQSQQSQYLTVKQAASYMNISKEYLYALARAKRIRHIKIGAKTLFTIQDIDEFLRSKTVEPEETVKYWDCGCCIMLLLDYDYDVDNFLISKSL